MTEALQRLGRDDINQLPVVSNGEMREILSSGRIMQIPQAKAERSM